MDFWGFFFVTKGDSFQSIQVIGTHYDLLKAKLKHESFQKRIPNYPSIYTPFSVAAEGLDQVVEEAFKLASKKVPDFKNTRGPIYVIPNIDQLSDFKGWIEDILLLACDTQKAMEGGMTYYKPDISKKTHTMMRFTSEECRKFWHFLWCLKKAQFCFPRDLLKHIHLMMFIV